MPAISETPRVHKNLLNPRVPFTDIHEPGTYVSISTGNLFRIPEEALAKDRSPVLEIVSETGTMMTKLGDDPWMPISKARQLAADADLCVNF